ncbi:hypothetical protein TorRG33x02_329590 [Trema orientale]|uniref:Uncharacterized protein n=1 Tax=Trema orientale TaxID=63057 RepID=A0A2P5B8B1_TREOI|nr:hypothetical protein TorRG33x02_329590 [Trema orientale]
MKSTMLKLFGYDDDNIAGLELGEAQALHELIKLQIDKMSKASSSSSSNNSGQKLKKLKMAGLKKGTDDHHGDNNQRRMYGEIEETELEAETNFRKFKNFDILESSPPSDHRFIALNNFTKLCGVPNGSLKKKISQEWEILKAELPNSIFYVRVYRSRVDLMRVAVIAEKSSYYHFLSPRLVFLRRRTLPLRIIHLSLLSSITIILMQLTSNLSPNFNNEGRMINFYDKDAMMQKNGGILTMLGSPPKQFEVFVKGYFLIRAHYILLNYKAFMNPDDEDSNRFFFKLVWALEANGGYCKHHYNKEQYDQALMEERRNRVLNYQN